MSSESFGTSDQSYWDEYSNLQRVKHDLIHRYLGGWFPKLGLTHSRILYIDSHAGRGRHLSGELSSPLVALRALLEHRSRGQILKNCKVQFVFLERDEENKRLLDEELREFHPLPKNVEVDAKAGDYSSILSDILAEVRNSGGQLGPAFMFIDPFGFKISGELLSELMSFPRVELFINVMWRELDMAIAQGSESSLSKTLDYVFSGTQWRTRIKSSDVDVRAEQTISLLKREHWCSVADVHPNARGQRTYQVYAPSLIE